MKYPKPLKAWLAGLMQDFVRLARSAATTATGGFVIGAKADGVGYSLYLSS